MSEPSCALCGATSDLLSVNGSLICSRCASACARAVFSRGPTSSALDSLRNEVAAANWGLPKNGLVTMHSGNASGFDPDSDTLVIKPSGLDYDRITPANLVAVRVSDGAVVGGELRPSVDLPHHLFLYRNLPNVRAVIHTHSNYATAFATAHRSIPVALTSVADEFGDEIPCTPYVDNEGTHIGEAILAHMTRAPAMLLANHGIFAWGSTPAAALKAAVMVEDAAKTLWLAHQLGPIQALPSGEAEKWYERYHTRYGQQ